MEQLQKIIDNFARILLAYYNGQMQGFAEKYPTAGIQLDNHSLSEDQINALLHGQAINNILKPSHALSACVSFEALLEKCITDICEGIVPGDDKKTSGYNKRRDHLITLQQAYSHFNTQMSKLEDYQDHHWRDLQEALQHTIKVFQGLQSTRDKQQAIVGNYSSAQLSSLLVSYTMRAKLSCLGTHVNSFIPTEAKFHDETIVDAIRVARSEQQQHSESEAVEKLESRVSTIESSTNELSETYQVKFAQFELTIKQATEQFKLLEQQFQARLLLAEDSLLKQQKKINKLQVANKEKSKAVEKLTTKVEGLEQENERQSQHILSIESKQIESSQTREQLSKKLSGLRASLNTLTLTVSNDTAKQKKVSELSEEINQLHLQIDSLSKQQLDSRLQSIEEAKIEDKVTALEKRVNAIKTPYVYPGLGMFSPLYRTIATAKQDTVIKQDQDQQSIINLTHSGSNEID